MTNVPFSRRILVHWNDCDPAGIAFHGNFIRWMDEGFTELLRSCGLDFAAMQAADPAFRGAPLVNVRCSFRSPARFGTVLEHSIAPPTLGEGRPFKVQHQFFDGDHLAAEGEQVRVWGMIGSDGKTLRSVPMPSEAAQNLGAIRS